MALYEQNTSNLLYILILEDYNLNKEDKGRIMKIKPIFDRVVLAPVDAESETKSGIVLPTVAQEKSQEALVVATGDGTTFDGKDVGMRVKEGDKVIYSKYAGSEVEFDGKKYVIVRQADILAILK